MSKKCIICGEENQDVSKYCHICGFKFDANDDAPVLRVGISNSPRRLRKPKRDKKNITIVFLIVVIALLGVYLMYDSQKTGSANEDRLRQMMGIMEMQNQRQREDTNWDFKYKEHPYFNNSGDKLF